MGVSDSDSESDTDDMVNNEQKQPSFIRATKIRHPIIERLLSRTTFVPNDIIIGCNGINGLVIFGTNGIGKTVFMRATGLCVVMAQMGCYVPAESFTFIPFHSILTRLSGEDDMYRGKGSFEVEMSELRDIAFRCDKNSLVLADELCRGTEQVDANSIATASVLYLSKRTNFLLATHLHDIPKQPELQNLKNILYKHLKITRDPATNVMTYHRTFEDGPGDSNYGIEVARANDVPEEILKVAEAVRKRYMNKDPNLVPTKTSRYNSKVYMVPCWICKSPSQETHHIKEQSTANEDGIIEHFNKNNAANLIPLCKKCHDMITYGELEMDSPVWTTNGVMIPYRKIGNGTKNKHLKQASLLDYGLGPSSI